MNKITKVDSELIGKTVDYVGFDKKTYTDRIIGINRENNIFIFIDLHKGRRINVKPTQIKHIY